MTNLSGLIKSIRDIMREDRGINGDAQRIEQLGWMLFLKIFDDKDQELELLDDNYKSPIPKKYQWRKWAADEEGMTGEELQKFIDQQLFPALRGLTARDRRSLLVREVFEGNNNYMKSGITLRKVLNKLNEIDFNIANERHLFGDLYETILKELQSAGDSGEFYTPRAVTQFMTDMINPKLGEIIYDPACGTGGFLTCTIEHLKKQVKNIKDRKILQENVRGTEYKPLPFLLALTNLILHDVEVPNLDYGDSLGKEYNSIREKDRVDVILANPPFGGTVANGNEGNFPMNFRTKESADLFLILIIHLLKKGGRSAIVLPDGSLTGDGVKQRVREKLLMDCNVHTIIRLPDSVFQPYATEPTNILFFEKGVQTKYIWFCELCLPEGQKAYSKTKPIQLHEFNKIKYWWTNREPNDFAWKVSIEEIESRNFKLDFRNPNPFSLDDKSKIIKNYRDLSNLLESDKKKILEFISKDNNEFGKAIEKEQKLFFGNVKGIRRIRDWVLYLLTRGKLTEEWRISNNSFESVDHLIDRINSAKFELKESGYFNAKYDNDFENILTLFEIPISWKWVSIGKISILQTGATPSRNNRSYFGGEIKWLVSGDIHKGEIFDCDGRITKEGLQNSNCKILPKNSVMVALNGQGKTRATVALLKTQAACNQSLVSITPFIDKEIISEYLYLALKSRYYEIREITGQKKRRGLNMKLISKFPVPLPPIDEQKKIIEISRLILQTFDSLEKNLIALNALTEDAAIAILRDIEVESSGVF